MRRHGMLIIAGALALAAFLIPSSAQAPAGAAATRVAVCDVVAVFNDYQKAKDLSGQFDERAKQIQAEGEQRQKAVRTMQETLEALVPGSKEYESQLQQYDKLSVESTVWLEVQKKQIARERFLLTEQMYQEVLEAIAQIAKEGHFDLVFHRDSTEAPSKSNVELLNKIALRKCLYANPQVDLTQAVLTRVNQNYAKQGK